jgi:predicted RNase H-like HicB family nuclease
VSVDELPGVVERGKTLLFECKAILEGATARVEASLKEIDDGFAAA